MAHAGLWLLAGVVLGSVTGAATSTFLAPRQAGGQAESATEFAARVASSMEQAVERAVERVREETAAAQSPQKEPAPAKRTTGDPAPEGPRRPAPARESAPAAAEQEDDERLVRDGTIALAPKNRGRLQLLVVRSRETEAARRREWMFVGEKAVAAALGVPDSVQQDESGREHWRYEIPFTAANGRQDSRALAFTFARGRVVAIDGAKDIRE